LRRRGVIVVFERLPLGLERPFSREGLECLDDLSFLEGPPASAFRVRV
jgi:hypothetical protein